MPTSVPLSSRKYPGLITEVDDADVLAVTARRWHPSVSYSGFYVAAKIDGKIVRLHNWLTGWPYVDHAEFMDEIDAADAYDRAAWKAWGEFARLNNARGSTRLDAEKIT